MPKPTRNALLKHGMAVIMLAAYSEAPGVTSDYDFEWFDTDLGRQEYLEAIQKWCEDDAKKHGDLIHLVAEVEDTEAMTLGAVTAYGGTAKQKVEWVNKVKADPNLLVAPSTRKTVKPEEPMAVGAGPSAKVANVTKGRSKSAAAAVLDKAEEDTTPKVKAKPKRGNGAKPDEPAAEVKPANGKGARQEALRKRLAEQKAAEPGAEAEAEQPPAEQQPAEPEAPEVDTDDGVDLPPAAVDDAPVVDGAESEVADAPVDRSKPPQVLLDAIAAGATVTVVSEGEETVV